MEEYDNVRTVCPQKWPKHNVSEYSPLNPIGGGGGGGGGAPAGPGGGGGGAAAGGPGGGGGGVS